MMERYFLCVENVDLPTPKRGVKQEVEV